VKLVDRVKSLFGFGRTEGAWRGPFFGLGELGGSFLLNEYDDGWQRNLRVGNGAMCPIVYACVMAQARAVSSCIPEFKRIAPNGGHTVVGNHPVAALLRSPNEYSTWPQFITSVVTSMQLAGEAVVLILRDGDTGRPKELHQVLHGSWAIHLSPEDGSIFYGMSRSGNPLLVNEVDYLVPARDVIHFRQHTPRHPLIGESPITAAALAVGVNVALSESQLRFFTQMRRPSGIISTDEKLTPEQLTRLRVAFDAQAADMNKGKIPILASGLKFQALAISSQDAELIAAQRMSIEDVCRVFGVPPPIVADLSHASLNNAETLINHWLALGLGSLLENIERSFDKALRLPANEYIELNTRSLLRTDFVGRIEGLSKGVAGGIMAPNEARALEGLPPVDGGERPFLQAQMVPVSVAATPKPAPAPAPTPAPATEPVKEPVKSADPEVTKALVLSLFAHKRKAA
jgi:HK97 family phage portal protein